MRWGNGCLRPERSGLRLPHIYTPYGGLDCCRPVLPLLYSEVVVNSSAERSVLRLERLEEHNGIVEKPCVHNPAVDLRGSMTMPLSPRI